MKSNEIMQIFELFNWNLANKQLAILAIGTSDYQTVLLDGFIFNKAPKAFEGRKIIKKWGICRKYETALRAANNYCLDFKEEL